MPSAFCMEAIFECIWCEYNDFPRLHFAIVLIKAIMGIRTRERLPIG